MNNKNDRQLKAELKLAKVNATYYKNLYKKSNDRVKYLIKHSNDLQLIIDRGYKQSDTFNQNHSGIYRIYNVITNQSYVGQSCKNVYERCMSHFICECTDQNDWHYDLQHKPEKYDYEIIVEGVKNQGDLDRLEIYYIGYYNCLENGYNKVLAAKYRFIHSYKLNSSISY